MRILYHHRTQAEDGQAVHIRALQQAFVAEGHELEEVALVERAAQPAPDAAPRVSPHAAPATRSAAKPSPWRSVTKLPRFARELAEYGYTLVAERKVLAAARRFRPDFVYERYAFGNLGGVRACRKLGVPLVLEVNSPMVLELSKTRGLSFPATARRIEKRIFHGADLVCVVTGVLGEMLVELGVARERLLVTPNGVHLEQYREPTPAGRAAARTALGLATPDRGDEGLVLGFTGYYRDWHRLDLVIEALTRPELAGARLVLIGEGPARAELEARARATGTESRVHFVGPRPHAAIPALLEAFDVALVPAINPYASPLKLHEYMAARLAVIAPDQPNLREILVDRENARLVPPGDGEALARVLVELALDPTARAGLGAAARRTIHEHDLTWRGNAKRVVARVQELLR
ncbi:MAG: glycosyltransferase family 4 protein [Planctomycetes bacterium]|nr:glycosyltransferase family 4 protein [Planctomycetota bacterium]